MFIQVLFTAIGFLLIFLILSAIALICAKPGRKWVWALYGVGAGFTAIAFIGSLRSGVNNSLTLATELILFVIALIVFGVLINKRLSAED